MQSLIWDQCILRGYNSKSQISNFVITKRNLFFFLLIMQMLRTTKNTHELVSGHLNKTGPTFTYRNSILLSVLLALLDKVMSHNQWHILVHECHFLFKGPMQLNFSWIEFHAFLCNDGFLFCITTLLIPLCSNEYLCNSRYDVTRENYRLQFCISVIILVKNGNDFQDNEAK